jgi:hypothetical protein
MEDKIMKNKHYSVVDLISIDHRFLRESFRVLLDEHADPSDKLSEARIFLNLLKIHCSAKARTVYSDLKNEDEFKSEILDAQNRHRKVSDRLRSLHSRITEIHWITPELSTELKLLAETVLRILDLEARNLLPLMKKQLSELYLCDLGIRYEKFRKFTSQELERLPGLPVSVGRKVEAHLNSA